jgi:glycogen debranching enzyme
MDEIVRVEDRFYILAAASRAAGTSRVLKHGDTFALFDARGDILAEGLPDHGLYHDGTRFLSRLRLRLADQLPLLLSSRVRTTNDAFGADLTNPDILVGGAIAVPRDLLHLYRSRLLLDGTLYESIRIGNHGAVRVALTVTVDFDADFVDIFEVRGTPRARRGERLHTYRSRGEVALAYLGLDGVTRRSRLRFEPEPGTLTDTRAEYILDLAPQQAVRFTISLQCEGETGVRPARTYDQAVHVAERQVAARTANQAHITTSHEEFNRWIDRSAADLRMMLTDTPEGPYPYAGVPWFNTAFGRDGIITALSTLTVDPSLARGVLGFLASTQADAIDPEQDAEPGKILHETRRGEMAALGEVPFGRYYGTIDATPLFLVLAGAYAERTGDHAFIDRIWPHVLRALAWIDRHGDADGDGFVEYRRRTPHGLVQQGWKDSQDSVFHADGTLAEPPIALCEVQGYVFDGKRRVAALARARGEHALAADLESSAERLRAQFEDVFWCEEIGTYALALDGAKRPCRVRASNAGHCLFSGIASPERARRVAATLLDQTAFSGWGIRTLAASERRYNPMSYHNGSIWPHDNAIAAAGFARYGLTDAVTTVAEGLFEASRFFDLHRMPELFCGFHRRPGEGPTLYPVACSPQAWAAAAVFLLVDALLQIRFNAASGRVHVAARDLPRFLDRLAIEHLEVSGSRVDVRVDRAGRGLDVRSPELTP